MEQKEMIFDVSPAGTIEGMHYDSFPLQQFGEAEVERASEIFFNKQSQLWDVLLPDQDVPFGCACGFPGYDVARRFEDKWLTRCRKYRLDPVSARGSQMGSAVRADMVVMGILKD